MALMFHRAAPPAHQKVLLATPVTEKLDPSYAFALYESAKALERAGIASELALHSYDCHVDDSRNRLVRQLLKGNCTDLMFLDSDVRWEAHDLVAALTHDCDVLGALYPLKQDPESYALEFLEDRPTVEADERGLVEVGAFSTGFMRIRRAVLEKLAQEAPLYWGKGDTDFPTPLIFSRSLEPSDRVWNDRPVYIRVGGDIGFCRQARAAGFKVWVMPEVAMEHTGAKTWRGHFGNFMRRNMAAKPVIQRIGKVRDDASKD